MMKTWTLFFVYVFFLPVMLTAQTVDEMLQKVSVATEAGQQGQAVSYFRQAIGLSVERSEMFYWTDVDKNSDTASKLALELATSFKKKRNYDKAFLFYKELLLKNPNQVDYLAACAEMEVFRGNENEALSAYEKVLKLDADHLGANIFLGNYFYLKAEREKSELEENFKKIVTPNRMQYARYRDGLTKVVTTGYGRAKEALQRVIQRFPSAEAQKTLEKILLIEKEVNR